MCEVRNTTVFVLVPPSAAVGYWKHIQNTNSCVRTGQRLSVDFLYLWYTVLDLAWISQREIGCSDPNLLQIQFTFFSSTYFLYFRTMCGLLSYLVAGLRFISSSDNALSTAHLQFLRQKPETETIIQINCDTNLSRTSKVDRIRITNNY